MNGTPSRRMILGAVGVSVVLMLTVTVVLFTQEVRRLQAEKAQRASVMGALPDFALIDQAGQTVTRDDLLGRVLVVSFVFTRCAGPCPDLVRQMGVLNSAWGSVEDVAFVSITVDPGFDTPEVLADYARRAGAEDKRWTFLTGSPDRVVDLVRNGFRSSVAPSDGTHQIEHSLKFAVVDRRGRIRAYLDGTSERLISDAQPIVRRLLAEN